MGVKTAEKHRAKVMKKLGLRRVQALTACVIKKGMVAHGARSASDRPFPGTPERFTMSI